MNIRNTLKLAVMWFALSLAASAQTVTVVGYHFGGTKAVNGSITLTPLFTDGTGAAMRLAGGAGIQGIQPFTTSVVAGYFTIPNVPDTSVANPANVCYAVTAKATSGLQVLGKGFGCLQTAANNSWCYQSVCNFDQYVPNLPALALIQSGPTGPPATFRGPWASGTTYSMGDLVSVTDSSGVSSYASLQAANTGNNPTSSPASWGVVVKSTSVTNLASQTLRALTATSAVSVNGVSNLLDNSLIVPSSAWHGTGASSPTRDTTSSAYASAPPIFIGGLPFTTSCGFIAHDGYNLYYLDANGNTIPNDTVSTNPGTITPPPDAAYVLGSTSTGGTRPGDPPVCTPQPG